MKTFSIILIAIFMSFPLDAQQLLKLYPMDTYKVNELNKQRVLWSSKYHRKFKLIKQKTGKHTFAIIPSFSDVEKKQFLSNEANANLELEFFESEVKTLRKSSFAVKDNKKQ